MRRYFGCIVSAAVAVLLIIGTVNGTLYLEENADMKSNSVQEVVQSDVVVQDFIYDNYVISEKNPWTDYSFHSINYTDSSSTETLGEEISAKAAILVNVDSMTVMYGKNIDKKMYPASTTKLMTALTVLQIMNTSDVVTIGDEVSMIASDSSKAGFSKGQIVTVEELLEGLLISSGNDAAYILAKAAGQKILEDNIENEGKTFTSSQCVQRFIFEMNKNVRDMDLKNTNFTSPDGYDDKGQYTTASDLSKIAIEAYENDTIMKICQMDKKYSKTLNKTWTSTNELIKEGGEYYYQYCLGMKTGSTGLAGKCFVSVASKDSVTCISVVLNDTTEEQRWKDSLNLLNYGLNKK